MRADLSDPMGWGASLFATCTLLALLTAVAGETFKALAFGFEAVAVMYLWDRP